jgi:hypothetical protein
MPLKAKDIIVGLFSPAPLAVWCISSMSVSLAGPFGTFAVLSYGARLSYWGIIIGLSIVIGAFVRAISYTRFPANQPVEQDMLSVFLMTLIFSPLLYGITKLYLPDNQVIHSNVALLIFYVAAISTAVFVLRRLIPGVERVTYLMASDAKPLPRLLRRLPEDFVGPILRLSVRDHFVDVVTPKQTYTIRMRFGDAIEEMQGVAGYCTHRSHWVVADVIQEVLHCGAKTQVRLVNGDMVPVSRKYRPNLVDAGLIRDL